VASKTLFSLLSDWAAAVEGRPLPKPPDCDGPDISLSGFVEHTDDVAPGKCFVARVRTGSDGHAYIGKAVAAGASLILGQRPVAELAGALGDIPYLRVKDTAVALAWLAAAWHGFPSRRLVMIGVTGTDGKTTTTNLIFQILKSAGLQAGMISTIKASIGDEEEPLELHVTTPEAPIVQAFLGRMVEAGVTHCVLEATSHGLAQRRVEAVDFDLAVVTNITHEHLDYHGDYAGYFKAKARLFESLQHSQNVTQSRPPGNEYKEKVEKTAILNADDRSYEALAAIPAAHQLTYALDNPADITASNITYRSETTTFMLHLPHHPLAKADSGQPSPADPITRSPKLTPASPHPIATPLPGRFNIYNILAASAAAHALGLDPKHIAAGIAAVKALPGRMEAIDRGQPFRVLVDFAHTPHSLEAALRAAREMTGGNVITVFGSAGRRDVAKRRLMAEAASEAADLTVLTAEDPRTESLDGILEMMAQGCRVQGGVEGTNFWRVPDRGQAIYFALSLARPEDLVLICGKGHEQSMCFGVIEYPWDDMRATAAALDALLSGEPMPDLGLPTYRRES
jgi:UDP-N-acetylmuramoyl-L-alanyl-D-glutamate--2,6-diaminopimelate ligase